MQVIVSRSSARMLRFIAASTFTLTAFAGACNLSGSDPSFTSPGFGGSRGPSSSSGFLPDAARATDFCATAREQGSCNPGTPSECEDGDHANVACNGLLRCSTYNWESQDRDPPPGCSLTCPKAFVTELPNGCVAPNAGALLCDYPEGTCGCAPVRPSTLDGGATADAEPEDAGDAGDAAATYVWTCVQPEAGCPKSRPRIGSECVRPMSCDYGHCAFENGAYLTCSDGYWRHDLIGCD